jgi:hypothetical protein
MPPRWPRQPDRKNDPEFRRLDDRMNFAFHVAVFAAVNSGLWFFRQMGAFLHDGVPGGLPQTPLITEVWAGLLAAHLLYVFAIAKYPPVSFAAGSPSKASTKSASGKSPKTANKAAKSSSATPSGKKSAAKSAPTAEALPSSMVAAQSPADQAALDAARQSKRSKRRSRSKSEG